MTDELPGAGPELDSLVAKALGSKPAYHLGSTPQYRLYSKWSSEALLALETWREQHPGWSIEIDFNQPCHPEVWEVCLYDVSHEGEFTPYDAIAPTLAVAICHAIVLAGRAVQG